ncbi:MAG: ribonuclease P protein subunit [Candidatus Micrarchaeota archaeon]
MQKWNIMEKNIGGHEWIGLEAVVEHSTDPHKRGLAGKITDETKNTLKLETTAGEKTIPKKEVQLKVKLSNGWTKLDTAKWCFSPENRVKAFFKNKR